MFFVSVHGKCACGCVGGVDGGAGGSRATAGADTFATACSGLNINNELWLCPCAAVLHRSFQRNVFSHEHRRPGFMVWAIAHVLYSHNVSAKRASRLNVLPHGAAAGTASTCRSGAAARRPRPPTIPPLLFPLPALARVRLPPHSPLPFWRALPRHKGVGAPTWAAAQRQRSSAAASARTEKQRRRE